MEIAAGLPFEAVFESGLTGLVPGIELSITDNVGNTFLAATGVGIVEQTIDGNPDTGIYAVTLTAPAVAGQYTLTWSTNGSFDEFTVTVEGLDVIAVGNIIPAPGMPTTQGGPCTMWGDINDIPDCCNFGDVVPADVVAELTSAMVAASEFLYFASGKQFAGSCERTVRACEDCTACSCCQVLSRGYVVWPWNWDWSDCNCHRDSRLKLAGYATEIVEVTIDGVVIATDEYELRDNRWLVRLDCSDWPCQTLVTYVYGKTPPESGRRAALKLACEVFKSCPGPGASIGDCELPTGVTRITRQGVTIERAFLQRDAQGVWRTGMAAVDFFLNSVNPDGIPRRATFWSASRRNRYARS